MDFITVIYAEWNFFFPNSLTGESMARPGQPPAPVVGTGEHASPTHADSILQPEAYNLITLI